MGDLDPGTAVLAGLDDHSLHPVPLSAAKDHRSVRAQQDRLLRHQQDPLADGDAEAIRSATERLEKASHRLAEVIYKSNAGAGADPADPGAPGAPADDDVIEAEVVNADEGNKN